MNENKALEMRDVMNDILALVGKRFNCDIKVGKGNYSDTDAKFELKIIEKNSNGESVSEYEINWRKQHQRYGFKLEDLNREFIILGKSAKLIGCMPRKSKYPIIVEINNKKYKYSAQDVKFALATSGE